MKFLSFIILAVSTFGFAYTVPDSVRAKYQPLYESQIVAEPDGSLRFHQGRLFMRGGIRVLSLKGDKFEMAFQHGRLLESEIAKGALPETALLLDKAVRNSIPEIPVVSSSVVEVFYQNYTDKIVQHAIKTKGGDPNEILAEAYGLAEGARVPLDLVVRGVLGPESLQVVLGERMKGKKAVPTAGLANSCTDFVAKGEATVQGEMIIGRNTDYPLNGFFDKYPTVIYYHPTDGDQKYLAVTSAGLHNAGVIGFNESGLFIGIHTIPTTEVSTEGNPVFLVGQEVIQKAKTFDEAVAIFDKYKPAAGWTYTLASVYENRVASIELTNKRIAVRESPGSAHVQTNHYRTPELKSAYLELTASITEDSLARLIRAQELIEMNLGHFSVNEAVQILSSKYDPINKQVKGFGNVIAVNSTLSSAVFDPSRGRLFVASGMGPVSLTPYIELPLLTEFDESNFVGADYGVLENRSFIDNYPNLAKAEQKFIEAKIAYEIDNNSMKASLILSETVALDPENAAYSFAKGILSLKAGDLSGARESFKANLLKSDKHFRLASQYYLGRISASQRKASEAKAAWENVLREADPVVEKTLIKAVVKSLKKLQKTGAVPLKKNSLVILMSEADMVEY